MKKSLYYIECTCIKNVHFSNATINEGEVLYFNKNASSNEMYFYNGKINSQSEIIKHASKYRIIGQRTYLPFTRKKQNAKKWEIKRYADQHARLIDEIGDFKTTIKEIKVTYEEDM